MPRRSSGGRSRSAPTAAARAPLRNPPQPVSPPPPAPVQRGPVTGGLGSVIAEGMAFGGGSAIAHRAVDAMVGPRVVMHEASASSPPSAAPVPTNSEACDGQLKAFTDCLSHYGSDISKCQFYMDMLSECRKSSPSSLSA